MGLLSSCDWSPVVMLGVCRNMMNGARTTASICGTAGFEPCEESSRVNSRSTPQSNPITTSILATDASVRFSECCGATCQRALRFALGRSRRVRWSQAGNLPSFGRVWTAGKGKLPMDW